MTAASSRVAARARVQRAVDLLRKGEREEARSILRSVLARDGRNADALHFLGLIEHAAGRPAQAIAHLRRAVEAAPDYTDALNNLANMLQGEGVLDEARDLYRRVLVLAPEHPQTLGNLGAVLRRLGEVAEAERVLRRAIERQPEQVEARCTLGRVLAATQRTEEAIACWREAMRIAPRHPAPPRLLGRTLVAAGRADAAREVYREWVARDPGNAEAAHLLAASSDAAPPARAADGYVRAVFDALAGEFDAHLARLDYRAPALIDEIVSRRLPAPACDLRVLDAGCGTGLCAPFLRPRARAGELAGVDLSPAMLARAARLGLYDELIEGELTSLLRSRPARYDLVVSADTLCYFGALEEVVQAAAHALAPGGLLAFTVEASADPAAAPGYGLSAHGRYCHSVQYVNTTLAAAGFEAVEIVATTLRSEGGRPVAGLVAAASAPARPPHPSSESPR